MIFCIQVSSMFTVWISLILGISRGLVHTKWQGAPKQDVPCDMQFAMVRELFRLAQKAQQEYAIIAEQRHGRRGLRKAKLGYSQQWYFFAVATFWMYLR